MGRLENKVAVVTGGGSGIGAASAAAMAAEGAFVVVTDIDEDAAATVTRRICANGADALSLRVDAGDADDITAMIDLALSTFGRLDILHNNAAALDLTSSDAPLADLDPHIWAAALRVNLTGPMLSSRAAIPHMLANGGGSIIHTSSVHAAKAVQTGLTCYSSTKSGLNGLMRAIAVQYGKQGIRSNSIAPGLTLSPFVSSRADEQTIAEWMDFIPAPAPAQPEDQAALVVFLASDEARFVNGQVLTVDGGAGCLHPSNVSSVTAVRK